MALFEGRPLRPTGSLVIGEKGKLYSPGDYCEQEIHLLGGIAMPEVKWVRSPGHFAEWIRAIRGGEPATSNFSDYAGPLSETVLLGNLAVWVAGSGRGERVEWDAKEMESPNLPASNRSSGRPIVPATRSTYDLALPRAECSCVLLAAGVRCWQMDRQVTASVRPRGNH